MVYAKEDAEVTNFMNFRIKSVGAGHCEKIRATEE
jgi:hypothetical protein